MRRAYAGVLLAMTVLLIGTTGTPLYDGIGFPDEPYRYVHPPQGYQQKYQPTEARATVAMANGTNRREGQASSSENGPQVSLYIPPGELHVTSGAAAVVIRARAVAAAMLPTDGSANSNVYDVDLGPDPVTLSGDPPNVANITMREAVFQPVLAVMEYRPDAKSAWRRLETQQVGRDIFLGFLQGPGEYVLVQPGTGTTHRSRMSVTSTRVLLILGLCVLLVALVLLAVRRMSTRGRHSG